MPVSDVTSKNSGAKRLVFFSHESFDEMWRRNQFICAELHRRHNELEILWVGPRVDILFSISKGRWAELNHVQLTPHSVHDFRRILQMRPAKLLPNKIGKGFNQRNYSDTIRSTLRSLGWNSFQVWINDQSARTCLPLPGQTDLVYDITDDWSKAPQPEHARQAVIADDAYLLENADHVIVCSKSLFDAKQGKCKKLALIANGVDEWRYHPDALCKVDPPHDLDDVSRPIAGYVGTLHSSRLDLELIRTIADRLPQMNFVFVGPNCLSPQETASIKRSNVHILGTRSYDELPRYFSAFDICMTPHLVNSFTDSLDPLKLYEYMSTGKPIVSTACSGFRDEEELIYIAQSAGEFVHALENALNESDRSLCTKRSHWARQHSWGSRVDRIEELLGWRPLVNK